MSGFVPTWPPLPPPPPGWDRKEGRPFAQVAASNGSPVTHEEPYEAADEFLLDEHGRRYELTVEGDRLYFDEPRTEIEAEVLDPSLYPIDLGPILNGTSHQPLPTQLRRDDGSALLYPGSVNGVHGDSGTGKGWIVCYLIQQNAAQGVRTMLLDFEDTAHSITARLRLLGMSDHDIETWLVYLRPQVPLNAVGVHHLATIVCELNVGAVAVDSLGEAFGLAGVNEDKDAEVGPWLRMVARPLAETGAAVVLVDHSTKAGTNDLHPSGSKRKRAAITGASYLVEATKPFVKDQGGRLQLTCAKDRHGNYRRGDVVGNLVMDSSAFDVRLNLYAPSAPRQAEGLEIVLTARAAVAAARTHGKPLSQNALVGLMKEKVTAASNTKRGAIDYAVSLGALREDRKGQARLFTYVHDLEEDAT